jgi:DNA-binding winged helix-turn-helix (wHTH) protein
MADVGVFSIGEWRFDPRAGEIVRGAERRRLEHRAAMTLELLCRRGGEVVSHADILAHAWNGRSLSENTVPVVIADLRRALGDDARAPRYIETAPKRGYRLLVPAQSETIGARGRTRTWGPLAAAAAALALLAGAGAWLAAASASASARPVVYAAEVVNDTGDGRYQPVARAVDALIPVGLAGSDRLRLVRTPPAGVSGRAVELHGRLILWTNRPTLMLSATDRRTGELVWSGMAAGPEPRFPATVPALLRRFAADIGRCTPAHPCAH